MEKPIKPFRLPASRRKRARLDQHATAQTRYRETLSEKNAPTREDFARMALSYVLFVYETNHGSELAAQIRRAVVEPLIGAGFDREQVEIRFGRMAERASENRERWRHRREWDRQRKAEGFVED